jgi:hypothetical protein
MISSSQTEPVSTEHLLMCLGLAIDEAKLVRSLIQMQDLARKLKIEKPSSDRLRHMNQEIDKLEHKLVEVRKRSQSHRGQQ